MLQAIYVMSKTGTPLYVYNEIPIDDSEESDMNAILFSGLFSAIQAFLNEITIGEAEQFSTKYSELFIKSTEDIAVVVIASKNTSYTKEEVELLQQEVLDKVQSVISDAAIEDPGVGELVEQLFDPIIKQIIRAWKEKVEQSKAVKKMRESLW